MIYSGATRRILSTIADGVPSVNFEAIVLIEPALITREVYNANLAEREGALKLMNKAISKRRDLWDSREAARDYFEQRFPWMMWDPRVRELFIVREHVLSASPGSLHAFDVDTNHDPLSYSGMASRR